MRQADLNGAVARATRESTNVIRQLGFSLVKTPSSVQASPSGGGSASSKPRTSHQHSQEQLAA
jgi:hypothetical protein